MMFDGICIHEIIWISQPSARQANSYHIPATLVISYPSLSDRVFCFSLFVLENVHVIFGINPDSRLFYQLGARRFINNCSGAAPCISRPRDWREGNAISPRGTGQ